MRHKILNTETCKLLIVELTEGIHDLKKTANNRFYYYRYNQFHDRNGVVLHLPEGNWELLCKSDEVTEAYIHEFIPLIETPIMKFKAYPNFYTDGYKNTALESWSSLLQVNEIMFENPIGQDPCEPNRMNGRMSTSCFDYCQGSCWEQVDFDIQEWQEAQSKVWDKSRTYIFKQI